MGWTYNTVNPDAVTTGPMITGVASVLTALSLVAVCLRLYVRLRMIKAPGYGEFDHLQVSRRRQQTGVELCG